MNFHSTSPGTHCAESRGEICLIVAMYENLAVISFYLTTVSYAINASAPNALDSIGRVTTVEIMQFNSLVVCLDPKGD